MMTTAELRQKYTPKQLAEMAELDLYIAENVTQTFFVRHKGGGHYEVQYNISETLPRGVCCPGFRSRAKALEYVECQIESPTTDGAAAMKVLRLIMTRSAVMLDERTPGAELALRTIGQPRAAVDGETDLNIAICKLAKQVFGHVAVAEPENDGSGSLGRYKFADEKRA